MLELNNLSVRFGGNEVLIGMNYCAKPGFNGLIGPNGAGKTTVFNTITGYVMPHAGGGALDGHPLPLGKPIASARLGIRRTFQTPKLVAELSVLSNVLIGVDATLAGLRGVAEFFGVSGLQKATHQRALDLLRDFGLQGDANKPVSSLSLGTQKVVEVLRALVSRPRVLLLDEPAAGLSAVDVDQLVEPLARRGQDEGLIVVIIEHDLELVSRLCSRVAAMHFGRIVAEGTPSEVLAHPEVVKSYIGGRVAAEAE